MSARPQPEENIYVVRLMKSRARGALYAAVCLCAVFLLNARPATSTMPFRPDAAARLARGEGATTLSTLARLPSGLGAVSPRFAFSLNRYAPDAVVLRRVLVLLTSFADTNGTLLPAHFDSLLFSSDRPEGSMRQYYLENSYGRLEVAGEVGRGGWLRVSHAENYYANNFGGLGSPPQNAQALAAEVVRLADPYVNFADFDDDGPDGIPRSQGSTDDDGYVDYLIIVHAGTGRESSLLNTDIHSHTWLLSQDVVVDGVHASAYSMVPEDGQLGVFCHEFGHLLGLPDLYADSGGGLGLYSIMATGSWAGRNAYGDHPTHLDAWSKSQLGFVQPTTPTVNQTGAMLPPVESTPAAWRLWTNGAVSSEYFLAENRQYIGFDDVHRSSLAPGLPGAGVVIYHVDEQVSGNLLSAASDTSSHLKIAVVEADGDLYGRGELQGAPGPSPPNWGDAGDPFPGAADHATWSAQTTPSSRRYDGTDSQVALSGLLASGTSMIVDAQVENAPALRWRPATLLESPGGGNNDGEAFAGETATLSLLLANLGLPATDLRVSVTSLDPALTLAGSGEVAASAIAADDSLPLTSTDLDARIAASLPSDPYAFPIQLVAEANGSPRTVDTLLVGAGAVYSFAEDAESNTERMTAGGTPSERSTWHRAGERNATLGGAWSWKYGDVSALGSYAARSDARLTTPPLLLDGTGRLQIRSFIDAENAGRAEAYDGGLVEISIAGGEWQTLVPEGGYPFRLRAATGLPRGTVGRGVFSGHSSAFTTSVFSLAGIAGVAQIRFRFISDASEQFGGWYVDDIQVDTDRQPYTVTLADPIHDGNGTLLSWRVNAARGSDSRAGFAIYRGVGSAPGQNGTVQMPRATLSLLTPSLLAPSSGSFTDITAPEGVPVFYVLADSAVGRSPRLSVFSASVAPVPLHVTPAPVVFARSTATIIYTVPSTGRSEVRVKVRIVDATGRLVAQLRDDLRRPGPDAVTWDGRTATGRPASSGIYLAVVEAGETRSTTRFTVFR
jgi:immune inhibitor A